MEALKHYETLLSLSRRMVALAEAQAWDELAQLETKRARLLLELPIKPPSQPAAQAQKIGAYIKQIQGCDQQVLEHVTPWREQTGALLARLAPKT